MLHIILMILKVIGIILLTVLGIILALLLLILFLPVRYRGHLVREEGPMKADVTASWLLRLACADYHYEDKKGVLKLKIFGKTLKSIEIPRGGRTYGEGTGGEFSPESGPEPSDGPLPETGFEPEEDRTGTEEGTPETPGKVPGSEYRTGTEDRTAATSGNAPGSDDRTGSEDPGKPGGKIAGTGRPLKRIPGRIRDKITSAWGSLKRKIRDAVSKSARAAAAMVRRAAGLLEKLCGLLFRGQELPSDIGDRVDAFAEKAERKILSLRKKTGPFLTEDAFAFYRRALRYLAVFLRSCRLRSLEGYLLIGTGQPDRTGEAIGLISLILPDTGGEYDLQADFYGQAFRTDTAFKGHIRLNHAVMLAIRLFKDREFRRLLAHLRHRDGKKQKKEKGKR